MSYEDDFDITDHMELTDDERLFLHFYKHCTPDIRDLLDKFMAGTPEEREEAGAKIEAMVADLRRKEEREKEETIQ